MTPPPATTSGPGRPAFSVAGQRVLVVGAARSGLAAAELLVARGAQVTLTDHAAAIPGEDRLREIALADPQVAKHLEGKTVKKVVVAGGRLVSIVAS